MPDPGYQGWSNYSTWAMNLWIDNDQSALEAAHGVMAEAALAEADPTLRAIRAGNALKEFVEGFYPEDLESPWADLLRSGWDDVDWNDIAEHHLKELRVPLVGPKEWRPRRRPR